MSLVNGNPLLTTSSLLVFVSVLFIAVALNKCYAALRGPLSRLPGPQISKWTNLRYKRAVLTGERVRYIHALHRQYGPVVRVSPREVSLSNIAAAKKVYKMGSEFKKSPWYQSFTGDTTRQNLFTMVDTKQHGAHRRLVAANFSEKWVKGMEPFIHENVRLAISKMQAELKDTGRIDVYKWFTLMATDILGEAAFGDSFHTLKLGKKNQYVSDLELTGFRGVLRAEFPWFAKITAHIPFGWPKEINRAVVRVAGYAEESIQRYYRQLQALGEENAKPTLLTKEYAAVEDGTVDFAQLRRDAAGYIIAGTDTTALAATYTVWQLAHRPEYERALVDAIAPLGPDFTDEELRRIPYLDHVIKETLRMWAPVGQGLFRIVPEGGAEFDGQFVPAGTTVAVQQYTLARDPQIYADPDAFNPSRWENTTKEMKDASLPWGAGSRVCVGQHFAMIELRSALTHFYKTFPGGVRAAYGAEGFDASDMVPMAFFLGPPRGKRCLVQPR